MEIQTKFEYGFKSVNGIVKKQYYLSEIPFIQSKCDVWGDLPIVYVRQFTGRHDNNGKEIYQGDIIQSTWNDSKFIVEWNNHEGEWIFCPDCNTTDGKYAGTNVIGNIHENPALFDSIPVKEL